MTEPQAKVECGNQCRAAGFCCNNPDVGSNQMFSCAQACMVRYYGASQATCQALVDSQAGNTPGQGGCSNSFQNHQFGFCSRCADLDPTTCPHGVQSAQAGHAGCAMSLMTEELAKAKCGNQCKAAGFCCNNPDIGSNQMFSCAQACMVRYYGASQTTCEALVHSQTGATPGQGGCSNSFQNHQFSFCSRCADLDTTCPHGVQGASAGLAGCAMDSATEEATNAVTTAPVPPAPEAAK